MPQYLIGKMKSTKTVKVRVKTREYTFGLPGGGYKTIVLEGEVPLTESVKRDIEAGVLEVIEEHKQESKKEKVLEEFTVKELKEKAKDLGIELPSKVKKEELIAAIKERQGGE